MLLSPLRNERKPLICSWCLRAHDLMCCGYLGDGALSPADLGVVFLAGPALLAAQPKKSGAARLEFVLLFFPGPRSYARLKILLFRCSRRWSFRSLLLVGPCCSHAVCFRYLPSLKQQRAKRRWEQHTSNRDSDQREQQEQEEQQLQQQQKQQESTGSKAAGGDS